MMPNRIQRKRTKGWRMPEGAVYVGRPTRWGNPIVHVRVDTRYGDSRDVMLSMFRRYAEERAKTDPEWLEPLRGRDLACWCGLCERHRDGLPAGEACAECSPCHASVLLEICAKGEGG